MSTPNPDPYLDWYEEHIPHRVRAAIAGTEMLSLKLQERFGKDPVKAPGYDVRVTSEADSIALLCCDSAVWEGRLAATRWLIDFLGIRAF